jgi:hypothetical protein
MIRTEWSADKIERSSLDRLIPYARNARTHGEKQVAQIAASILEFGWTMPCLLMTKARSSQARPSARRSPAWAREAPVRWLN